MLLERAYADRLERLQTPLWKRLSNVQAPYGWNLRRLRPGRMLDVGCGIGRNLAHVPDAVGVDPNESCIAVARSRGFRAFTPDKLDEPVASFDSLLIAHVLEHLTEAQIDNIFCDYLHYLKPGGLVILITPQERGFASDPTHLCFVDFARLYQIINKHGLNAWDRYSFPFPRWVGKFFRYNEFIATAHKPA